MVAYCYYILSGGISTFTALCKHIRDYPDKPISFALVCLMVYIIPLSHTLLVMWYVWLAGKDRTGVLAALVLKVGAFPEWQALHN